MLSKHQLQVPYVTSTVSNSIHWRVATAKAASHDGLSTNHTTNYSMVAIKVAVYVELLLSALRPRLIDVGFRRVKSRGRGPYGTL